jgi:hypothetical protein
MWHVRRIERELASGMHDAFATGARMPNTNSITPTIRNHQLHVISEKLNLEAILASDNLSDGGKQKQIALFSKILRQRCCANPFTSMCWENCHGIDAVVRWIRKVRIYDFLLLDRWTLTG